MNVVMGPPEWRPVLDGYVLPYIESEYGTALAKNNHGDVPVLTGNNADESGASPEPGYTLETYIGNMTDVMGNLSTRYFERKHSYPVGESYRNMR